MSLLESFFIIVFPYIILHTKKEYQILALIGILDASIVFIHSYYSLPQIFLTVPTIIISFLLSNQINKKEYMQNLFLTLYAYLIMTLPKHFLSMFLISINIFVDTIPYFTFICFIASMFLYIYSINHIKKYPFYRTDKLYYLFIILMILSLTDSILIETILSDHLKYFSIFLIIIMTIMMLFFIIFLFYETKKEQQEFIALQEELLRLENQVNMYELNTQNIQELKRWKHDMKHILESMKYHLDHQQYDQVHHIIQTNLSHLEDHSFMCNTGFDLLDYILIHRNQLIKAKNIDLFVSYIPCYFPLENTHFFMIMGNLLDNAIENCESLYLRQIKIDICEYKSYFCIKIQNSIISSVLEHNPHLTTTKDDSFSHGLGLKNIKLLLSFYDGIIDFSEQQNFFIVKVMIPINAQFHDLKFNNKGESL